MEYELKGERSSTKSDRYYSYLNSWRQGLDLQKIAYPAWPKGVSVTKITSEKTQVATFIVANVHATIAVSSIVMKMIVRLLKKMTSI